MTNYDLWVKACHEMGSEIALIETKSNRAGTILRLYKMITKREPCKESGWNSPIDVTYMLWTGTEKRDAVRDLIPALQLLNNRMKMED